MFIVMIPMQIAMMTMLFPMMSKPGNGQALDTSRMRPIFGVMAVLWPICMVAMLALQAEAMRWMLRKARWSDFRVVLTRPT